MTTKYATEALDDINDYKFKFTENEKNPISHSIHITHKNRKLVLQTTPIPHPSSEVIVCTAPFGINSQYKKGNMVPQPSATRSMPLSMKNQDFANYINKLDDTLFEYVLGQPAILRLLDINETDPHNIKLFLKRSHKRLLNQKDDKYEPMCNFSVRLEPNAFFKATRVSICKYDKDSDEFKQMDVPISESAVPKYSHVCVVFHIRGIVTPKDKTFSLKFEADHVLAFPSENGGESIEPNFGDYKFTREEESVNNEPSTFDEYVKQNKRTLEMDDPLSVKRHCSEDPTIPVTIEDI